jgi:sortase A
MRVFAPSDHQLDTTVDNPVAGRPLAAHHETVRSKVTRWEAVGVGLTGVGVLLLLFLVYLYAFTPLTGVRDQHRLLQTLAGHPRSVFSLTTGRPPALGQPVALLELPGLHERQVVVNGTAPADLQEGPGLMTGTAVPGEPGDAVIAGRRVTYGAPFGRLSSLGPSDPVKVVDGAGTFTFRVVGTKVVPLGGRDRVPHSGDAWLTLVTSNSSVRPSGEFVVLARLVGRPAVGVRSSEVGAPSVRLALAGDPSAGRLALVWAVAFLFVLAATLVAVRRWRQPAVTYLLAAPILLACGLFVCENLAQCLPATL